MRKRRGKPDADFQCFVNLKKAFAVHSADIAAQPGAVNGAKLLQQHHRAFAYTLGVANWHMGGQRLFGAASDGGHDNSWAVAVANIVLQNQYGANAALFASNRGA